MAETKTRARLTGKALPPAHKCSPREYFFIVAVLHLACFAGPAFAGPNNPPDFFQMSLEELVNVEVTLASKKEERLFETPAAVYVITCEDIRRTGATSIPEALRMVPGLQVAKVDNNKWAITARGFNSLFADKLLVLIDGRTVYTPLYAGVYWDVQDVMLEDVERIEVIRGPGGTLWGANAVNGIINIVTKKAKDTQGTLLTGGGGTEEKGFASIRYGGKLGNNVYYRAYSKYFNRDEAGAAGGSSATDDWQAYRAGFRIDWDKSERDQVVFQGDIYDGDAGQRMVRTSLTPPFMTSPKDDMDVGGGNILARWTRKYSATSDTKLQFYYDRTERSTISLSETRDTFDLDFQHHLNLGYGHDLVWGLGYRYTGDNTDGSYTINFSPSRRDDHLLTAFVQDEITIAENLLKVILGSKFEINDYTDFEFQPTARLLWTPNKSNTIWAAFTRAVQTPSRTYADMRINYLVINPAMVYSLSGSDDVKSQELKSYELGYRIKPKDNLFFDLTAFYSKYNHLYSLENNPTAFTKIYDNKIYGETYGAEISAHWQPSKSCKLAAGYNLLQIQADKKSSSTDTTSIPKYEDRSPRQMFNVRCYLDLPGNFEFDTALYYVDTVPYYEIPGYIRLDARLGWHIKKNLELSVVAQNLLDNSHPEFEDDSVIATEVERAIFVKLTYRF